MSEQTNKIPCRGCNKLSEERKGFSKYWSFYNLITKTSRCSDCGMTNRGAGLTWHCRNCGVLLYNNHGKTEEYLFNTESAAVTCMSCAHHTRGYFDNDTRIIQLYDSEGVDMKHCHNCKVQIPTPGQFYWNVALKRATCMECVVSLTTEETAARLPQEDALTKALAEQSYQPWQAPILENTYSHDHPTSVSDDFGVATD